MSQINETDCEIHTFSSKINESWDETYNVGSIVNKSRISLSGDRW